MQSSLSKGWDAFYNKNNFLRTCKRLVASLKRSLPVGVMLLCTPRRVVTEAKSLPTPASVRTQTRSFCCVAALLPVLVRSHPAVYVHGLNFLDLHKVSLTGEFCFTNVSGKVSMSCRKTEGHLFFPPTHTEVSPYRGKQMPSN